MFPNNIGSSSANWESVIERQKVLDARLSKVEESLERYSRQLGRIETILTKMIFNINNPSVPPAPLSQITVIEENPIQVVNALLYKNVYQGIAKIENYLNQKNLSSEIQEQLRHLLAFTYNSVGNPEKAIDTVKQGLALEEPSQDIQGHYYFEYAKALNEQQKHKEALEVISKSFELQNLSDEVKGKLLQMKAMSHIRLKDYAEAVKAGEEGLKLSHLLDCTKKELFFANAFACNEMKHGEATLDWIEKAFSLSNLSDQDKALFWLEKVKALSIKEDFQGVITTIESALELSSLMPNLEGTLQCELAKAWNAKGRLANTSSKKKEAFAKAAHAAEKGLLLVDLHSEIINALTLEKNTADLGMKTSQTVSTVNKNEGKKRKRVRSEQTDTVEYRQKKVRSEHTSVEQSEGNGKNNSSAQLTLHKIPFNPFSEGPKRNNEIPKGWGPIGLK